MRNPYYVVAFIAGAIIGSLVTKIYDSKKLEEAEEESDEEEAPKKKKKKEEKPKSESDEDKKEDKDEGFVETSSIHTGGTQKEEGKRVRYHAVNGEPSSDADSRIDFSGMNQKQHDDIMNQVRRSMKKDSADPASTEHPSDDDCEVSMSKEELERMHERLSLHTPKEITSYEFGRFGYDVMELEYNDELETLYDNETGQTYFLAEDAAHNLVGDLIRTSGFADDGGFKMYIRNYNQRLDIKVVRANPK